MKNLFFAILFIAPIAAYCQKDFDYSFILEKGGFSYHCDSTFDTVFHQISSPRFFEKKGNKITITPSDRPTDSDEYIVRFHGFSPDRPIFHYSSQDRYGKSVSILVDPIFRNVQIYTGANQVEYYGELLIKKPFRIFILEEEIVRNPKW